MLKITTGIEDRGVIIDLRISQSLPREAIQRARHRAVPDPINAKALIDTGADFTLVDGSIILDLGLAAHQRSTCQLYSLDTKAMETLPVFDVDIRFVSGESTSHPFTVEVAAKTLGESLPYKVLLGRDLLKHCILEYNGVDGVVTLTV